MPPGEELRPALPNGIRAPAPNRVAEGTVPLPGEELRSVENLVADGTAPLPGEDIALGILVAPSISAAVDMRPPVEDRARPTEGRRAPWEERVPPWFFFGSMSRWRREGRGAEEKGRRSIGRRKDGTPDPRTDGKIVQLETGVVACYLGKEPETSLRPQTALVFFCK
jgi:hypothetical protein